MKPHIRTKDVVNRTGGIVTDDGRTLYGLDAEVYKKMKAKEDPEWERKVGEWIEDVLGHSIPSTSNLWLSLKSGLLLVELVNTIKPDSIKKYNKQRILHVLMERKENINLYLDACWKLGVPKSGLFVTSDLHGRRNMSAVLSNISCLSQLAPTFGVVKVAPIGKPLPTSSSDTPKKWKVDTSYLTPVTQDDLINESDMETQLQDAHRLNEDLLAKIQSLEKSKKSLLSDVALLREKLRLSGNEPKHAKNVEPSGDSDNNEKKLREEVASVTHLLKEKANLAEDLTLQMEREEKRHRSREGELLAQIQNLKNQYNALVCGRESFSNGKPKPLPKTNADDALTVTSKVSPTTSPVSPTTPPSSLKILDDRIASEVGVEFFNSYDDLDASSLWVLTEITCRLMNGSVVEYEEVSLIKPFFTFDSGRRLFSHLLRTYLYQNGVLAECEINSDSFEILLFLINLLLCELDITNGADYISGKVIFELSSKVYHKASDASGKKMFIEEYIQEHFIWQSLFFWEEYFWDSVSLDFKRKFCDFESAVVTTSDHGSSGASSSSIKANKTSFVSSKSSSAIDTSATGKISSKEGDFQIVFTKKQKEYLKMRLRSFAVGMISWGQLPIETISYFVEIVGTSLMLSQKQLTSIQSVIISNDPNFKRKTTLGSRFFSSIRRNSGSGGGTGSRRSSSSSCASGSSGGNVSNSTTNDNNFTNADPSQSNSKSDPSIPTITKVKDHQRRASSSKSSKLKVLKSPRGSSGNSK